MNQEKIGKLIAKLRKDKGLTQRQLGEMVGVGYRAVSKWETGLTMPDISIINELSTILGISSDELLSGELSLKEENNIVDESEITKKTFNKKKLLFLLIPLLIIIIILVIMNNKHHSKEYVIKSLNPDEYQLNGILTIDNNNIVIKIDEIEFQDYDFRQILIDNYQYRLFLNQNFIFGMNADSEYSILHKTISIEDFTKKFTIYYKGPYVNNVNNGNLLIELIYYKMDGNIIKKQIETTLKSKK